jgi:hypothetical protein
MIAARRCIDDLGALQLFAFTLSQGASVIQAR